MELNSVLKAKTVFWIAAGLICCAVMCAYTVQIAGLPLFPQKQITGHPYKSDLIAPWEAANALLVHGENPYSALVSQEIQRILYGRALRTSDPPGLDQQKFAYPIYTLFLIVPIAQLRFDTAANVARIVLPLLVCASLLLWFRILRISPGAFWATSLLFVFASWPIVQGLALQQLGLLVFFLITAACYAVVREQFLPAGVFVGLAMIKPQMALPFMIWLSIWVIGDFRKRWRVLGAAILTVAVLCAAGELMLRGWIPDWIQAVRDYASYAAIGSILRMLFGTIGAVAELAIAALTIMAFWKRRRVSESSDQFSYCAGVSLAVGLLLSPVWASHNQIALVPGALLIWTARKELSRTLEGKSLLYVGVAAQAWSWIGLALVVTGVFRIDREVVTLGLATFLLPVIVPASLGLLLRELPLPGQQISGS